MLASDISKYGSEKVKVQDTFSSEFWPSAKMVEEFLDEPIVDHILHEGMPKEQITSILDYWKKHVNFINTHHVVSKTALAQHLKGEYGYEGVDKILTVMIKARKLSQLRRSYRPPLKA